jgi:hypothetical protein
LPPFLIRIFAIGPYAFRESVVYFIEDIPGEYEDTSGELGIVYLKELAEETMIL